MNIHQNDGEPEPDDAELIAYLDGELEPDEARKLESKLAVDAKVRTRATEYKKTFDLLDYLPKSEPSADFTNRTLTRIQPALQPGSASSHAFIVSSSGVVPHVARTRSGGLAAAFWIASMLVCAGLGYGAHLLARPYLAAHSTEAFDQADLPMIHELPLLLGVDDLEFLRKLHAAEIFDDEPSVRESRKDSEPTKISLAEQQKLIEIFLAFPQPRQQQLRKFHQQLNNLPAKEQSELRYCLENYAAWLDRLPDAERQEILAATSGEMRLNAIKQIRERLWRESLPQSQKALLARAASAEETLRMANELHDREQSRREEWELAKRQWQPNKGDQPKPWPFSDPVLIKQLDQYVKNVLGVDLSTGFERKGDRLEFNVPPACRLTREELNELKIKYDSASKEGYWGVYAECLYRMAERHPGLPKPSKADSAIVRNNQLPAAYIRYIPKDGLPKKSRFEQVSGKWPDFALAVHDGIKLPKAGEVLPPLGPSKPGEFADEVNAFLKDQLMPAIADPKHKRESEQLAAAEGKWPEYPRLMLDLAKNKNMIVPGVSLPGDPSMWAKFYKRSAVKK